MNHDEICARLPHAGRMCLLDRLESFDAESIHCRARSHRDADNPLRSHGRLHAVIGVEYAAQAMALHGSLTAGHDAAPAMGYLASVRDLQLDIEDLAAVHDDLDVRARRLSGDAGGFIYEFDIHAGTRRLLAGRLAARLVGPQGSV
jgi:predicted hotdog family 3-hydroxylacyl-ACP dehydratase